MRTITDRRTLNVINNDTFVYLNLRFLCRKEQAILQLEKISCGEREPRTNTNGITLTLWEYALYVQKHNGGNTETWLRNNLQCS
jgi:hypothetical protein